MFMRVRTDLEMTSELSKDTTVVHAITHDQGKVIGAVNVIKASSHRSSAEVTLVGLQMKVWRFLAKSAGDGATKTKEEKAAATLLKIVNKICSLLENRQLRPPRSEHGELASAAAKDSRVMVKGEFGLTNKYICGGKVDLSVRVYADHTWQNEIAGYEFKSSNGSDVISRQQQHKSVRLNGAILLDLEQRGVDISNSYPIIAEGWGLALDFYTLRRYDNVLGAGRTTLSRVWLPSHEVQLKQFLSSDSLHMLLAFAASGKILGYLEKEEEEFSDSLFFGPSISRDFTSTSSIHRNAIATLGRNFMDLKANGTYRGASLSTASISSLSSGSQFNIGAWPKGSLTASTKNNSDSERIHPQNRPKASQPHRHITQPTSTPQPAPAKPPSVTTYRHNHDGSVTISATHSKYLIE
ncbi:hypothetical protein KI688_008639 [Linnemannia hyalina]|uniref:Uncharacterized protein n=1 Tax=Linnemannia hyalina TaxID=64524 RepID=A0A9P8BXC2_9FUNG|nr:hypothetical protein KI688_008639 [Linnemannia hyalina]